MRLGTAMVEACCAAQIDTNNKVNRAIAKMVLKWRIETSPEFGIAFAKETPILSLCLLTCVFILTSLWSWVVAAVDGDRRRVMVWVLTRFRRQDGCPTPEAFPL